MPYFDGEKLIITLDAGQTDLSVQEDLYSAWKDWLLDDTSGQTNTKYPPAFRTIGGDDLTPGIKAGAYYFIRNDLGWRIRPPEEDITIYATGNLAPQDSSVPILIPTIGNFRVLVAGLQPITQNVAELLEQQESVSYGGILNVDFVSGTTGNRYPVGTTSDPVNNNSQGFEIINFYKLRGVEVSRGTFTLLQEFTSKRIFGLGVDAAVDINGQDVGNTDFINIYLRGQDFTNSTAGIRAEKVDIIGATNLDGQFYTCSLEGTISIAETADFNANDCFGHSPEGINPIIDFQNYGDIKFGMRDYDGVLELRNVSGGTLISIDLNSGHVILDDSCVGGVIVIRGTGHLTDLRTTGNTGTTLITNGLVEGDTISAALVKIDDLITHFGLDVNDPQTITEVNENEVTMENTSFRVRITKSGAIRTVQREDIT